MLGLRWQVDEWGYNKKAIKMDEKTLTLKFNGKEAVQMKVQSDKLHIEWLDPK